MTLTSILPSLRDSIPLPFDRLQWPVHSALCLDDVTVAAVSLRRYAELCGTPCVCTGPAPCAPRTDSVTVVVTTVTDVAAGGIRLDADLDGLHPVWRESRLLGRISHAVEETFDLLDAPGPQSAMVLPGDVRPGDLLALPVPGSHGLGEVRQR